MCDSLGSFTAAADVLNRFAYFHSALFYLCSLCYCEAGQGARPGSSSRPEVAASCFEWWDSIMTRTAAK